MGLVEGLADDDRELLAGYGSCRSVRDGEVVIKQGASQESLYFVLGGSLHAKRSEGGREILLGEIRMGEWFGEVNIFDPGEASATVRATAPSEIWSIDRSGIEDFLNARPMAGTALLVGIATLLSRRLRGVTARLVGRSEYASLLAELA
jgi:CRP/FNR family transcriptional regulator, cyclic AMP receptor protein